MYSIGGTVSGLANGANLVLQNGGGNNATVSMNGGFRFSSLVTNNMAYAVSVLTQPTGQSCTVASGSGTVSGGDVTGVQVTCVTNTFTVSGTLSGLNTGAQATLANNAADATTVTANGPFTFATPVPYNDSYAVTVQTPPVGQTCTVASGNGTVGVVNVTGVQVTCTTNAYTISGTVSGLNTGAQVTVLNNAGDPTTVAANGPFSFAAQIPYDGGYAVTVQTQPTGQTCVVTSGSGTVSGANVAAVQVTCSTNTYTISGTVSGLNTNAHVTLLNNGLNSTMVNVNGPFTLAVLVPYGSSYAVTVATQPPAQTCTVSAGTGAAVTSNVSGVSIACSPATESVIHSFDASADGISPRANAIQGNDGNFYGTTYVGGATGEGTVFRITPTGVETVLHSFTAGATDGSLPTAGLIQGSDGNFYGTTGNGGPTGAGTVFKITPAGVYTVIFMFTGQDGIGPGGLVQGSDGDFYGTTSSGGPNFDGTVFKVTPTGAMTILHSFTGAADGGGSSAALTLGSDGNFYGTTTFGGANNLGTVFKITPAGIETVIHSFAGGANDGISPVAALVQGTDGNFYGTTQTGGPSGQGTVFKITSAGVEAVLYSFTGGTDGSNPYAAVIQGADGNFYGTTRSGGTSNNGTMFKVTPGGVETVLHSFAGGTTDGSFPQASVVQGADGNFYGTNSDGGASKSGNFIKITPTGTETVIYSFNSGPEGQSPVGLVQANDGDFYGTTHSGGMGGNGTVFKVTSGGLETALYSFAGGTTDGYYPSPLIQGSDGNFYGTTQLGGTSNAGTVFRITPAGAESVLYSFAGGTDASQPQAALIQGSDGNFYGTSLVGGVHSQGTVFKITPSGLETAVYSFTGGPDGGQPHAALIQGADGNFYGTTSSGGTSGEGTVFKITPAGVVSVLYSFTGGTTDGSFPYAALVQAGDGNFYGTTNSGGTSGQGTVFKITPTGVESVLYSFAGGTSGDGGSPSTALIQGNDGNFYGTAVRGGISNQGILFEVTPTGVETVLYYFLAAPDGANPGQLIQGADGILYGTTAGGGSSGLGTVFAF